MWVQPYLSKEDVYSGAKRENIHAKNFCIVQQSFYYPTDCNFEKIVWDFYSSWSSGQIFYNYHTNTAISVITEVMFKILIIIIKPNLKQES